MIACKGGVFVNPRYVTAIKPCSSGARIFAEGGGFEVEHHNKDFAVSYAVDEVRKSNEFNAELIATELREFREYLDEIALAIKNK